MSLVSLALRILLAVALVLGGAGSVMAEVQMRLQHEGGIAGEVVAGSAEHHAEAVDCHDGSETGGPAASPAGYDENHSVGTDPQCCGEQACGCTCAQPGSIAIAVAVPGPSMALDSSTMPWPIEEHAAPLLQGLTRPPIG